MTGTPVLAADATTCRGILVRDRKTGLVDCASCGLHGRIGDHLSYSTTVAAGLTADEAYELARRQRRHINRMLRDGNHVEQVVNGPTARQLVAAMHAAFLASQMDPLFELPTTTAATDIETLPATGSDAARVADQQRLPHPNPHSCAHCPNRATLRLTLATGYQVVTCRPCATRYPR